MRARQLNGSVVLNRKFQSWNFLWVEDGKRRSKLIGHLDKLPTREAAMRAAESLKQRILTPNPVGAPIVRNLVEQYRVERMPKRESTKRGYESYLKNHILPKWGNSLLSDTQARPVELWLLSLNLSPKSKMHIRELLHGLWEYAMWRGDVVTQRNPMELVVIKGANQRVRKTNSLTVADFRALLNTFDDPCWHALLSVAVGLGLRISEVLGLKWHDIDWLNRTIHVERGVVKQIVDDVKSAHSARTMACADELLNVLKLWKQTTQFSSPEDWVFASPVKLGRQPLSYTHVWETLNKAAKKAGLEHISSHCFRHSYRTWLDSVGTPVGVQQKLMRHSDIRTTMNIYGDAATADMREANQKVSKLALG